VNVIVLHEGTTDEGDIGMIAGDIADRLGDAVLELTARRKKAPPTST